MLKESDNEMVSKTITKQYIFPALITKIAFISVLQLKVNSFVLLLEVDVGILVFHVPHCYVIFHFSIIMNDGLYWMTDCNIGVKWATKCNVTVAGYIFTACLEQSKFNGRFCQVDHRPVFTSC